MTQASPRGGLFASLRGLLATGVAILRTRIELLAVEVQEERLRVQSLLAYGAAALILLGTGVIFLSVFITVLLWDSHRLLVLGVFSALFLAGGATALMLALRAARRPSRLFAASLAELAADQAGLEAPPVDRQ